MFMQIAIGTIGLGVVLMVAYLIIAQVKGALFTSSAVKPTESGWTNPCFNMTAAHGTTACNNTCNLAGWDNTSTTMSCTNNNITQAMNRTQATIFAGFALVAVGIIVLAAFGLINVFQ